MTTLCLTVTVGKPVASSTFIIPRLDPTKLGPPQSTQKKTTPTKGEEYATLCGDYTHGAFLSQCIRTILI